MKPLVVLVTHNYPFAGQGGEVMFVAPEVERLARDAAFDLCVAPLDDSGTVLPVPTGVDVDRGLAACLRQNFIADHLRAWLWPGFAGEWRRAVGSGGLAGMARVWRWAAFACATWRWAGRRFEPGRPVLFYTYWRGGATLALDRLSRMRPRTATLTRVHGYELYEDRFSPPFQPWVSMYDRLDRIVTISAHGREHLAMRGVDRARLALHRLGTDDLDGAPGGSRDGRRRIVSCSFVLPLKRVPLIARAIVELARRHPHVSLRWSHFGDGPDMPRVRRALGEVPANLEVDLAGQRDNRDVREHYGTEPVDAFVLLSEQEGLPVSIQEALSAGVPIVATAVGGVPEAVGADNGVLLGADAGLDDVVHALEQIVIGSDVEATSARRRASRLRWERDFDAERNHTAFGAALRARAAAL